VVVVAVQWCLTGRADDASPQRLLQGIVADEAGTLLANAKVTAVNGVVTHETTTDAQGRFEFRVSTTAAGGIFVPLAAETSDGRLGSLAVQQQQPEPVRLVVKPGRTISVHVQDDNGRIVADADVVFLSNYRRLASGQTDASGRWQGRVPAELKDWTVVALKSNVGLDYATGARSRGAVAEEHPLPTELRLKLDGARTFKVKAVDRDNRSVSGVRVGTWLVQKPNYEAEINVSMTALRAPVTDENGEAVIDWLPAKTARSWTIMYHAENQYALDHAFFIPANDPKEEITINLLPIEELSGRVTHADGRPAEGIIVNAQGKGGGSNDCRASAKTGADGRYKLRAFSEQAYVVAIADKEWTAPYRADIVVRAGQPVTGIDFVLMQPTRVHGSVTMGKTEQPAPKVRLNAVIDKGQIPAELRRKDDRIYRPIGMFFYAQTDDEGHYEFLLGPGEYRLQGPPRTQTIDLRIPADNPPAEIVRDFQMPRPETGPLAVRVVDRDGKPMAGAMLSGTYAARPAARLFGSVKTDSQGTFKTDRSLDPLVLHAITADGQLGGVTRSEAKQAQAEIVVGPLAEATGRLLTLDGQPIAQKELSYAINVFQEPERRIWTPSFGGKITTDADGRFTFRRLVPGQTYEASIAIDAHSSRRVVKVQPTSADPVDLGDIKADTEPTKPYVPPTPAEKTAEAFGARPKNSAHERLDRVLVSAEREYTRPLLLLGSATDKACIELFRLFDDRSETDAKTASDKTPTPHALRWEFELLSLDDSRPEVAQLAADLGINRGKHEPMLAVLSGDGKLTATFPLRLSGETLDGRAIGRFLAEHKLPTRDASKMLADGLKQTQAEDKRHFFIFSASWCGPCRMLAEFLSQHKAELQRHYVFVKLDVSRDNHAQELREKYKESKSGGVPWFTILDADGKLLITSNAPANKDEPAGNTNIGFPSEKEGIEHFVRMLRETAPRLPGAKLAELREALLKGE
jgi:thiol-disulfide isomerase/thioredoxin